MDLFRAVCTSFKETPPLFTYAFCFFVLFICMELFLGHHDSPSIEEEQGFWRLPPNPEDGVTQPSHHPPIPTPMVVLRPLEKTTSLVVNSSHQCFLEFDPEMEAGYCADNEDNGERSMEAIWKTIYLSRQIKETTAGGRETLRRSSSLNLNLNLTMDDHLDSSLQDVNWELGESFIFRRRDFSLGSEELQTRADNFIKMNKENRRLQVHN